MKLTEIITDQSPDAIMNKLPEGLDSIRHASIIFKCIEGEARARVGDSRDEMCIQLEEEGIVRFSYKNSDEDYNVYYLTKMGIELLTGKSK